MLLQKWHTKFSATDYSNLFLAITATFLCYLNRIKTSHGSFSQEKALVTGYEAANAALDFLGYDEASHKRIISVEEDEPHIVLARRAYKLGERIRDGANPFSNFFMM